MGNIIFELHGELARGQRRAIKSTQCLENTICEERVTDVELFSKHKGRLGDNVIKIFRIMQGSHTEHGGPLVSLATEEAGPNVRLEHGNPQAEIAVSDRAPSLGYYS